MKSKIWKIFSIFECFFVRMHCLQLRIRDFSNTRIRIRKNTYPWRANHRPKSSVDHINFFERIILFCQKSVIWQNSALIRYDLRIKILYQLWYSGPEFWKPDPVQNCLDPLHWFKATSNALSKSKKKYNRHKITLDNLWSPKIYYALAS